MNIRKIEIWKRIFSDDPGNRYIVSIKAHCSQEELNTLKEKGIIEFLGGKVS